MGNVIRSDDNYSTFGGFCGRVYSSGGSISNSYSTGRISGTSFTERGFLGQDDGGSFSSNFFDSEASNQSTDDTGSATAKSTSEMEKLSVFTSDGWEIDDQGDSGKAWRIYDGDSYPLLRAFMTPATIQSVTDDSKTYDGVPYSEGNGYVITDFVDDDLIHYGGTAQGAVAAGCYSLTIFSGQQGYDFDGDRTAELAIQKQALTIMATPQHKTYGETLTGGDGYTLFTVGEDQLVGDEQVDTVTVSYTNGHVAKATVGMYEGAIVLSDAQGASGFVSANYGITYVSGTMTVDALIQASAGEYGTIDPEGAIVVRYGADQHFSFTPDPWYEVQDVQVDSVSQGASTNYNWQNVAANGTITVSFAESYVTNNTPVDVPALWMARYGLTSDMDTLVNQDMLGLGVPTWEVYVMDANPTNGLGILSLECMPLGNTNRIEWYASSNRLYTLYNGTNMYHGVTNLLFGPSRFEESGVMQHDVPMNDQGRQFYRVTVELP